MDKVKALPPLDPLNIGYEIHIEYMFWLPDRRLRDGQSYLKASTDQLKKSGVIVDDNWTIVVSERWRIGGIDRENPRVEMELYRVSRPASASPARP